MAQKLSAPLYNRRRGDCQPLHAYLVLDLESGKWATDTRGSGDGVSFRRWHGFERAFGVSEYLSQAGIDAILGDEQVKKLAERAVAGCASVWDGNNHVARYTADADQALEDLGYRIMNLNTDCVEENSVAVWDPNDWLASSTHKTDKGYDIDGVGKVTAKTGDATLAKMARRIEKLADNDDVLLDPEPLGWLERVREGLK